MVILKRSSIHGSCFKRYVNFGDFFFNTVFSTLINTILTLITVILGAFAVARVNFAGKRLYLQL